MEKIIINRKNRSITVPKSFEKKARVFGSPEYIKLTSALKDNPGFRLVVKNPPKNRLRSLSLEDMRTFLLLHGDFDNLKIIDGLCEKGHNFSDIKKWFLDNFDFNQKIDESVIAYVKKTTDDSTVA